MIPTFKVDRSEVSRTMKRLLEISPKSEADFVTKRFYFVLKAAKEATPIATRGQIQQDLGADLVRQKLNKKGKIVRSYSYRPTKLVYALINARQKAKGYAPFTGMEMESEAKKFIARRLRAVGSLKSGWNRAIGILASAVKEIYNKSGPGVKLGSKAIPANPTNTTASMEYRVTVDHGNGRQVDPRALAAFESGMDKEYREMLGQLEKEMRKVCEQAGAL